MASSSSNLVCLDILHTSNRLPDAAPVSVLNPASSLRDRAAFCWGLASQIREISAFISESENVETHRVGALFYNHLSPLVTVLESITDQARQEGD